MRRSMWRLLAVFFMGMAVGFLISPIKNGIGNTNKYYGPLPEVHPAEL